ncbi:uncharacterized protein LOC111252323 [Varroa destructor]|uniref:C2H2-type domain-containing protein n=1 Tax=Varroa destructor TaxID=109461 RepID=A0A7M7MI64_VARDE|nr:uncharacterized protein LOC111252323 [Varroa destructor]XP_022665721.1 uncharacterized protein LOC111252323 [Varroa destructor]
MSFILCAHCHFMTLTSKGLTIHLRRRHGIIAHNRPPRRKTMRAPPIRLANCSMRREAWMEPFGCAICRYRSASSSDLRQHFDTTHKQCANHWVAIPRTSISAMEHSLPRGRGAYTSPPAVASNGGQHIAMALDVGPPVSGTSKMHFPAEPLYGHTGQILGWKRPTKPQLPSQSEGPLVYSQQKAMLSPKQSHSSRSQQQQQQHQVCEGQHLEED